MIHINFIEFLETLSLNLLAKIGVVVYILFPKLPIKIMRTRNSTI